MLRGTDCRSAWEKKLTKADGLFIEKEEKGVNCTEYFLCERTLFRGECAGACVHVSCTLNYNKIAEDVMRAKNETAVANVFRAFQ